MDWPVNSDQRIPVGTHYRVWWFWLPIIFGGLALLAAIVLLPIFPPLGIACAGGVIICVLVAGVAGIFIERGRRWVELLETGFRLSDRDVRVVIHDEQVTDLALHRQPHHGAGKLLAETRHLMLWIKTEAGPQRLKLTSRMAPGAPDALQPLIYRLCRRLFDRATRVLAARDSIAGDGWTLEATQLHVHTGRHKTTLPLDDLSAVETIGHEIRLWQRDNPHVVAKLPSSGRNAWLLRRLLSERLKDRPAHSAMSASAASRFPLDEAAGPVAGSSPLGRILFERSAGSGATIIFGVLGLTLVLLGGFSLWAGITAQDPVMAAVGGMLLLLGTLCFAGGIRVRRVRFRCHERGLERITMASRKVLRFDDIDVFSFECRRNQSQGRYTGTTYTLVFADRSREQGRGMFYSTTVRNADEELDDLRDRVAQIIARRMAQTFAAHHSVQWTPEIWFREDSLEYSRPRRIFVPSKVAVIPYDTITDFEVRDGLFHIWTCYQERAVLTVNCGAPNFYPGLIVLESLVRSQRQQVTATSA